MPAFSLPSPPRKRRAATLARARLLASALLLGALGCSGPPGAGRLLGDDLGTFAVAATETANSCGPGALGSSQQFDFDVELSRADSELFWNGSVGGRVRQDLQFQLDARIELELRAARGSDPGCALSRSDRIAGVLAADAAGSVSGFAGVLEYTFAANAGSRCTAEEQAGAGLTRLPCTLAYQIEAELARAPAGP